MKVALLTGGKDPHYVRGLLRELPARGVRVVCVGSDELATVPAEGGWRDCQAALELRSEVADGADCAVAVDGDHLRSACARSADQQAVSKAAGGVESDAVQHVHVGNRGKAARMTLRVDVVYGLG